MVQQRGCPKSAFGVYAKCAFVPNPSLGCCDQVATSQKWFLGHQYVEQSPITHFRHPFWDFLALRGDHNSCSELGVTLNCIWYIVPLSVELMFASAHARGSLWWSVLAAVAAHVVRVLVVLIVVYITPLLPMVQSLTLNSCPQSNTNPNQKNPASPRTSLQYNITPIFTTSGPCTSHACQRLPAKS